MVASGGIFDERGMLIAPAALPALLKAANVTSYDEPFALVAMGKLADVVGRSPVCGGFAPFQTLMPSPFRLRPRPLPVYVPTTCVPTCGSQNAFHSGTPVPPL